MAKNHAVGYGKPPKHARFTKGRSGNPKGRPRGARNFTGELVDELDRKVIVKEGGVTKSITKRRAIILSLLNKALQGDARAIATIATVLHEVEAATAAAEGDRTAPLAADDDAILQRFTASILERHKAKESTDDDGS